MRRDLAIIGLGYVPAGKRTVTPVPSWALGLVPKPTGTNETVKENENTESDTIPLIVSKVKRTLHHSAKLAQRLKGKNLRDTAQNDFDFIFKHIKYVEDEPGKEQVRSPRRLIHEGKGDCDCFTVTLSSLLLNQGIPHFLRIMKQNAGDEWSHIYIVVPTNGRVDKKLTDRNQYIVVDPVTHKFDHEAPKVQHKDFPMALQSLDGIRGESCAKNSDSFMYYERTQQYRDRGLVITEEFLTANNIPFTIEDSETFGYRVGHRLVPAVITPDQAQMLLNPAVHSPADPAETQLPGEQKKRNGNLLWWLVGSAAVVYALSGDGEKDKKKAS